MSSETLPAEAQLVAAATAARARAYAPYSSFRVGAAVRGASGKIYSGANVENASYGLSICAERAAVFQAIFSGEQELTHLAVVTEGAVPFSPCGACRQVLAEFAGNDALVLLSTSEGARMKSTLGELLPHRFSLRSNKA